ncbi:transmembrane channel-like protein 7 isoform X2 [Tachypleus tridentatus]|uniref:transmembrane channel-like protein 7 isoform X2 n=1 Tax=Tachypleus tridentatus TaxID=6853 RepID=UPI003FD47977
MAHRNFQNFDNHAYECDEYKNIHPFDHSNSRYCVERFSRRPNIDFSVNSRRPLESSYERPSDIRHGLRNSEFPVNMENPSARDCNINGDPEILIQPQNLYELGPSRNVYNDSHWKGQPIGYSGAWKKWNYFAGQSPQLSDIKQSDQGSADLKRFSRYHGYQEQLDFPYSTNQRNRPEIDQDILDRPSTSQNTSLQQRRSNSKMSNYYSAYDLVVNDDAVTRSQSSYTDRPRLLDTFQSSDSADNVLTVRRPHTASEPAIYSLKHRQSAKHTMKKARQIARELGLYCKTEEVSNVDNNSSEMKPESQFVTTGHQDGEGTKRKCWARMCQSTTYHAHYTNASKELENRNKIKQAQVSPAAGFAAWELRQQKAKKKLGETWKELISSLNIWSHPLKRIEGYHGTGVVSYFLFLRWLLFLNLGIFFHVFLFILLPYIFFKPLETSELEIENKTLTTSNYFPKPAALRTYSSSDFLSDLPDEFFSIFQDIGGKAFDKASQMTSLLPSAFKSDKAFFTEERLKFSPFCSKNYTIMVNNFKSKEVDLVLQDFMQGTGWMELTLLFYGYYNHSKLNLFGTASVYNFPLAYLLTTLAYFLVSLVLMVGYTTEGVKETLMTSESQLHKYCNMVFAGWDFCIEDKKTARLKHNSITRELKGHLAEDQRNAELSQWTRKKKAKKSGEDNEGFLAVVIQLLPSLTITGLSLVVPTVFVKMVTFEEYSKDFEIKITLIRTVFLRLASIGILIYSFHHQISCPGVSLDSCKQGINSLGCRKPMCWETYIGQQLYKLVLMDFLVTVFKTFVVELARKLIVTHCTCANKIGRQEFDVTSNVLDLVYSQTLCWLGTFYSPLLPAITVIKHFILFYIKQFTVMVNCIPSQIPYRASRSNTFFMIVLMLSFVLCIIPLGYSIAEVSPSFGCGPFRIYSIMWLPVKEMIHTRPTTLQSILDFLTSAGFAVPCFIILCLALYYYSAQTSAHKHMANVLKDQLVDEGRDKQFLLERLSEVAKQRELLTT